MFTQGDYITTSVRSAAILTNSYVAGTVIGTQTPADGVTTIQVEHENQLVLYVSFTIGSLTDGRIKIEFSADNSTFYQETDTSAPTTGVVTDTVIEHKFTATGNYRIAVPIKDRYIKVSAMGTGTVTSSSMAVLGIVGVA